ncbi:MAG: hypothetical protein ACXWLS_14115, partial [Myxococcaceae bacterium]
TGLTPARETELLSPVAELFQRAVTVSPMRSTPPGPLPALVIVIAASVTFGAWSRSWTSGNLHPPARVNAVRLMGAMLRSALALARARPRSEPEPET